MVKVKYWPNCSVVVNIWWKKIMLCCFYLQSIVSLLTLMMPLFVPAASIFSFGGLTMNWSPSKDNCPQAMVYQGYGGYIQDPCVVKPVGVLCCVKFSARLSYLTHRAFGFHLPYLWMTRKNNVFIFHSYMSFVLLTQHVCSPFHFSFIKSAFPFVIWQLEPYYVKA
jgi:hypothetical protein